MFKKILKTLFGDPNERELKKLWPLVDEVNEEFRKLQDLSDEELQAKTGEFKDRLQEEVADIEARQEEIKEILRESDRPVRVGGDGQPPETSEQLTLDERERLHDELDELVDEHDLAYLEDPLDEDDFDGFAALTDRVGDRTVVCGDDLFATNVERLERGIEAGAANAILVKPNQIGTLSEAVDAIETATRAGYTPVVSHRSGETEDTTIAHLAVATGAPFIKTGAVGGERTAKLNELIRIEHEAPL
jgi:enolase